MALDAAQLASGIRRRGALALAGGDSVCGMPGVSASAGWAGSSVALAKSRMAQSEGNQSIGSEKAALA